MPNQRKSEIVRIKAAVRARDGRCVKCGVTNEEYLEKRGRSLDVHRTVAGSVYTLDSCQAVCQTCHNQMPKVKDGPEKYRLIQEAGMKPLGIHYMLLGLTQEEYDLVKAAAKACGLPMTKFIIKTALEECHRIIEKWRSESA